MVVESVTAKTLRGAVSEAHAAVRQRVLNKMATAKFGL